MAGEWYLNIFKQLFISSFIATTVWFNPSPPLKKKILLRGITVVPREIKDNCYAKGKIWGKQGALWSW